MPAGLHLKPTAAYLFPPCFQQSDIYPRLDGLTSEPLNNFSRCVHTRQNFHWFRRPLHDSPLRDLDLSYHHRHPGKQRHDLRLWNRGLGMKKRNCSKQKQEEEKKQVKSFHWLLLSRRSRTSRKARSVCFSTISFILFRSASKSIYKAWYGSVRLYNISLLSGGKSDL